jgi:hypothetical protein
LTYALNDKDRYGYYTVGDQKTYSKLEAIDFYGQSQQPIQWHYNTQVYGQIDWTQDPPGNLEFWYRARAEQIRNDYDYVVLWYSGGADSSNILNTFVKNNIFIDEIAQYTTVDGTLTKQDYLYNEVYATAIPQTKQLLENNPTYKNTVHRLVDISDLSTKLMELDNNKWNFFYHVNQYYSFSALSRGYVRNTVPEYRQLIDSGKKVCFIWGVEKPDVFQQNNQYYLRFGDGQDHAVSAHAQIMNRPWEYDEFFYWPPDMPQLPAKQAHIICRYLNNLTAADVDGTHVLDNHGYEDTVYGTTRPDPYLTKPLIKIQKAGQNYALSMRGLHRLIYPDWNPNLIVAGKPHGHMFALKDTWLLSDQAPDCGQRYYTNGVPALRQKVKQIDPNLWWEYKFDPKRAPYIGGVHRFYNNYCLGNVTAFDHDKN